MANILRKQPVTGCFYFICLKKRETSEKWGMSNKFRLEFDITQESSKLDSCQILGAVHIVHKISEKLTRDFYV